MNLRADTFRPDSAVTQLIGSTPTLDLQHPLVPKGKKLLLKMEMFNPTFSVKDRTAYGLIKRAITTGRLGHGGTVIESTSGNLGKALAMLCASLGLKLIVVVDTKVSTPNLNWYKAFGAQIELVADPAGHGSLQKARIARVKQILAENENAYWPNQYDNHDNPDFHESDTALEILQEHFDLLVGCVSTGGHLTGIARGVRNADPSRKVLACDVEGSAIFGTPFKPYLLNGVGLSWRSENTDLSCFDYLLNVDDSKAISMCRLLARECGLLVGGSAGLNVFGALCGLTHTKAHTALAIIPDSGMNYLDQFYDDNWLEQKNLKLLSVAELREAIASADLKSPEIA